MQRIKRISASTQFFPHDIPSLFPVYHAFLPWVRLKLLAVVWFPPCEAIERYAREHIEAQNPIKQFLLEKPETGMGKMPCKMVWEAYQGFYKDAEGCFPKRRDFNAGMEREGFRVVQGTSARHWKKAHKAG
jgi:hypothetical protein